MLSIDRLLQRRKIVTKVLLFLVPLVLLIAGVGLAGYRTATMLNGHMTVTRATIENISDFENLQKVLQDFISEPSASTRASLAQGIERQSHGVYRLEALVKSVEDRERIAPITGVAARMTLRAEELWKLHEAQAGTAADIRKSFASINDLAGGVKNQVDTLRKTYEGKERLAKVALYEADSFRSVARRLQNTQEAIGTAADSDGVAKAAAMFVVSLKQEFVKASGKLSADGKTRIEPVRTIIDEMNETIAGPLESYDKASVLRAIAEDFRKYQEELYASAATEASDAASRFVGLESEVTTLRSILEEVNRTLDVVDGLHVHIANFLAQPSEGLRKEIAAALEALRTSSSNLLDFNAVNPIIRDLGAKLGPLVRGINASTAALLKASQEWKVARSEAFGILTAGMAGLKNFVAQAQEVGKDDSERSANMSVMIMVAGTLLAIAGGLMLIETLRGPLRRVTEVMKRLAAGELDVEIKGRDREDEIGDMVRSVAVFRDAAVENVRLGNEAAAARELTAAETERRAAERARITLEQQQALTALSEVLSRLAQGDLERRMESDLPDDFVEMARTYNHAVEALRLTLADVRAAAVEINGSTGNLAVSADDLARRTEQQAAALEQSSRSLRHLSDIVRSTAESARQTVVSVNETEEFALRSDEIVGRAVQAMGDISASSEKIATIIGVIDEIAFQTNLLALNAGVEAARAGEAGKGFAVVAQEVRELAQRCAGAAREIKGLISASSAQVSDGVHLVQETGSALGEIIRHISDVRQLISQISVATREQSTGINEITVAVQNVELITQHNAAMVEENNAELGSLRKRVEVLSGKVERFKLGTQELAGQTSLPDEDTMDKNHAA